MADEVSREALELARRQAYMDLNSSTPVRHWDRICKVSSGLQAALAGSDQDMEGGEN